MPQISPRKNRSNETDSRTMYLNLIQIAESFGVSETVVKDWIRNEGLPHTPDRGRLLFDRLQVANWAGARGLAAKAGFLALETPALAIAWRLEVLLRAGGSWGERAYGADWPPRRGFSRSKRRRLRSRGDSRYSCGQAASGATLLRRMFPMCLSGL